MHLRENPNSYGESFQFGGHTKAGAAYFMTGTNDDLKTAAELVEKAAELLHEAAKQTYVLSEAARQSLRRSHRANSSEVVRPATRSHDSSRDREPENTQSSGCGREQKRQDTQDSGDSIVTGGMRGIQV